MESVVHNMWFRGDFTIKTVVEFMLKHAWKNVSHSEAFYSYAVLLFAD